MEYIQYKSKICRNLTNRDFVLSSHKSGENNLRRRAPKLIVRFGLTGLAAFVFASGSHAATLTAGPGQQFQTIASAVAASHDGDTVNVMAGHYVNDFAEIRTKITLQAVGGKAKMESQGFIPNQKAILITDTDVTINGFEFWGARVSINDGGNGAAIRYQGGNLTLNECYIHGNQEGLLAAPDPTGTVTISNSEFYHNGNTHGIYAGYTHNIYVNDLAQFDIENSYFHGAYVGHEIKSRAQKTIVRNTRVVDGPTGTASYSIDLPNGGVVTIENNQIEQGPYTQNPYIIAYGEEGIAYASNSLLVDSNLIENDLNSGYSTGVWNTGSGPATISNNSIFGLTTAQIARGPATITGTINMTSEPIISNDHFWR